jgi:hypothetical protein
MVGGSLAAVRIGAAAAAHSREVAGARHTPAAADGTPGAAPEVVHSRAAVREGARTQAADNRPGWPYRPKDRSGCQDAPEVGS